MLVDRTVKFWVRSMIIGQKMLRRTANATWRMSLNYIPKVQKLVIELFCASGCGYSKWSMG